MTLKPFSEEISTGQVQEDINFQDTEELTPFEVQTKTFLKHFGSLHPGGIKAFVTGLDKALKYGIKPFEIEVLFRTWFHNKGIVGDPHQKKLLAYIWPNLENKIDKVAPPYEGKTIYARNTPTHREGVPKSIYAEAVNVRRAKTDMQYHRDVGFY
jgi:hypothetical protein